MTWAIWRRELRSMYLDNHRDQYPWSQGGLHIVYCGRTYADTTRSVLRNTGCL